MSLQTETTLEACVARGVALLDEKMPGWREKIDLDELNLRSCADCILGQLYGIYATGLKELDFYYSDGNTAEASYGFTLDADILPSMEKVRLWSQLTERWRKAIAAGKENACHT